MKIKILALTAFLALGMAATAQNQNGGITPEMMGQIRSSYSGQGADKALRNAMVNNNIAKLALNHENANAFDTHFSNRVMSKAVTDQKSSGRCWMFTGMNVMRNKAIRRFDLPADFQFSQAYLFFYDQLEKSNLFLQAVIDTKDQPFDSKEVEWLFKNPLSDGGQFTGIANLTEKYGLVPSDVMPETFNTNNTSEISKLISLKLREFGLELRESGSTKGSDKGAVPSIARKTVGKTVSAASAQARKTEMLGTIYRMLCLAFGEPPAEFDWTQRNAKGDAVSTEHFTPKSFYEKYAKTDFSKYYMIMNDPTREYHKVYEIQYDRHVYDGQNWKYLNLPMEEIAPLCIASIKDSTMMYFSCDVAKFLDREKGYMDPSNYDYGSLMGTTFGMNKEQRVKTGASGSSHAMTLCAVDLDAAGKPIKWMVENSWGSSYGYQGFLIMSNEWFNEYMFRVVIEEQYMPASLLNEIKSQKPIMLPAWDPMFLPEE